MTNTMFRPLLLLAPLAMCAAACQQETGIPTRRIQGLATLPPLGLAEDANDGANEEGEADNATYQTADGPFSILYGYHIVRGTSDAPCPAITPEAPTADCSFIGPGANDADVFRLRMAYQGPIVLKARLAGDIDGDNDIDNDGTIDGDVDIVVWNRNIEAIYTDANTPVAAVDDNGDPIVDNDGNALQIIPPPRFATQGVKGDEFYVQVTVNSEYESADYELVIVGNDPRPHDLLVGIEGDRASFDLGISGESVTEDAFEMEVGAFLNNDLEALGNPVGGTSCKTWSLDEASETFWCAWEMVFLQQVSVEGNTLIPGMGDGIDNDCNGVADTGVDETDADGDGYTIADGDCNDQDVAIGPHRGDLWGDRKDNDCDGWADNGPDDQDADGDAWCENGRDLDGDGFCRGVTETVGLSAGDCNDADPAIHGGFSTEIPQNGIDDDCQAGDAPLSPANSDQSLECPTGLDRRCWSDVEEEACGTDPLDPASTPDDEDEDDICDSDCLGTVGCAQDWDGDNLHNWLELQCHSDPEVATTALPDLDGDGVCDGLDSDADGDGFTRMIEGQTQDNGTDCHDLDASIHPHLVDDAGVLVLTAYNYDVVDGVDNDCDGTVDENRDWLREGDGFVENVDYTATDNDGDGFALGQRDCNDAEGGEIATFGNWETRSANVVRTDFSEVFLFAGDVPSLNSTTALPDARRVAALVPYDLQKDRVAWEVATDWPENEPPRLVPTPGELPLLEAWWAKQPDLGKSWFEALNPDGSEVYPDFTVAGFSPPALPWDAAVTQELGDASAPGKTGELRGTCTTVVPDSWDGDADGYRVVFPEGGNVYAKLDWEGAKDLDAIFYCYYFDAINAPNYYSGIYQPSMAGVRKPEDATTVVPLPPGSDCYFFVVQYAGSPGGYTMEITVLE